MGYPARKREIQKRIRASSSNYDKLPARCNTNDQRKLKKKITHPSDPRSPSERKVKDKKKKEKQKKKKKKKKKKNFW